MTKTKCRIKPCCAFVIMFSLSAIFGLMGAFVSRVIEHKVTYIAAAAF